ncbi:hypothetical protein [Yoonia sp. R2-816]|uniref:hypothetical protein n=1 Tax=Yoonia sp. R2-816 TaxID=3342638 RepID=UPI00372C952A
MDKRIDIEALDANREIDEAYIDDLITDARLYATYGRYAGSFKDERLFQTIASSLRQRPISHQLVVELQQILNDTARDIPFSTVAALKAGWTPGRAPLLTKCITFGLVIASIILMVVVARLTLVHNEGTGLIAQAEELMADKPQQSIDRLVREHVLARLQMEERASTDPTGLPLNDTVSLSLLEANEAELGEITRRMSNLRGEIGNYIAVRAVFPLIGMKEIYCFSGQYFYDASQSYRSHCPDASIVAAAQSQQFQQLATDAPCREALLPDTADPNGTAFTRWREMLDAEKKSLACNGVIASTDFRGVQFAKNVEQLRWHVGYYALWILPALYGAMGAVMYHMRYVLDPLMPHPSLIRLLHRVVLASLAGIVLGWFYAPGSAIEQAATSVGFSLFVVSFLFGFSLDIFFAMLDRFVAFSERAVRDATKRTDHSTLAFARRKLPLDDTQTAMAKPGPKAAPDTKPSGV